MKFEDDCLSLKDLRRSAACLLSLASQNSLGDILIIRAGETEIGFSVDFVCDKMLGTEILPIIEAQFFEIVKSEKEMRVLHMMRQNAQSLFCHQGQPLLAESLETISDVLIDIFSFDDLSIPCASPHIKNSKEVRHFKLLSLDPLGENFSKNSKSFSYRILGLVFFDSRALKTFMKSLDGFKKKDHRRIGSELDLFSGLQESGPGIWLWLPKGALLRGLLEDWLKKENQKLGFSPVVTPKICQLSYLKNNGYLDLLQRQGRFPKIFASEGIDYAVLPSNAPLHAAIFRSKACSQADLPIRYAEISESFFHGRASDLWGMLTARVYSSEDGTIFCSPSQVESELISSLQFIIKTINMFGFEYRIYLSLPTENYRGTLTHWDKSIDWIKQSLSKKGLTYHEDKHIASLFGPRIDIRFVDSLEREWQGPCIGFNLFCPERFGLFYQGVDGKMHTPIMIERSIFGSLERFVAILVEHYEGNLPFWLSPEQVRILPVNEQNLEYATSVSHHLLRHGFRVNIDSRRDTLGAKIHLVKKEKVPYAVVVGNIEEEEKKITIRRCSDSRDKSRVSIEAFIQELLEKEVSDQHRSG